MSKLLAATVSEVFIADSLMCCSYLVKLDRSLEHTGKRVGRKNLHVCQDSQGQPHLLGAGAFGVVCCAVHLATSVPVHHFAAFLPLLRATEHIAQRHFSIRGRKGRLQARRAGARAEK